MLQLSSTGNIIYGAWTDKGEEEFKAENSYNLNKWIFVVGTYDGKKTKLYVDGNLTSSIDFLGSIPYYTGPLGIGLDFRLEGPPNLVDNFFFKGIVDDMRIYSCALSPEQIAEEYQQVYMNSTKK